MVNFANIPDPSWPNKPSKGLRDFMYVKKLDIVKEFLNTHGTCSYQSRSYGIVTM